MNMTTLTKKEKVMRWGITICLLLLIFLPSQIPVEIAKKILIVLLGSFCLFLQFLILRNTSDKKHRQQGIILVFLTLCLSITSLFL